MVITDHILGAWPCKFKTIYARLLCICRIKKRNIHTDGHKKTTEQTIYSAATKRDKTFSYGLVEAFISQMLSLNNISQRITGSNSDIYLVKRTKMQNKEPMKASHRLSVVSDKSKRGTYSMHILLFCKDNQLWVTASHSSPWHICLGREDCEMFKCVWSGF